MPIPVHPLQIRDDLREVLLQLDVLESETRDIARHHGMNPLRAVNPNGDLMMVPIVVAKAQALSTLYAIERDLGMTDADRG